MGLLDLFKGRKAKSVEEREVDLADYFTPVNDEELKWLLGKGVNFAVPGIIVKGKFYKESPWDKEYSFLWHSGRKDFVNEIRELYPCNVDPTIDPRELRDKFLKEQKILEESFRFKHRNPERSAKIWYPDTSRVYKTSGGVYLASNSLRGFSFSNNFNPEKDRYLREDVFDLVPTK